MSSKLVLSKMSRSDLQAWAETLGIAVDSKADKDTFINAFREFADLNLGRAVSLKSDSDDLENQLAIEYASLNRSQLRAAAKELGLKNYGRQKVATLRRRLVSHRLRRAA